MIDQAPLSSVMRALADPTRRAVFERIAQGVIPALRQEA